MEMTEEYRYDLRNMFEAAELIESNYTDYGRVLNYKTFTNGYTKFLTFDDNPVIDEENDTENHTPELMINLEIDGLGISLISDGNPNYVNERREILY